MVELRGAAPTLARICNISQGGARIQGLPALAAGTKARLSFDRIALRVPCAVVGQGGGEIRIKFELEGLGKRAFLDQLCRTTGFTMLAGRGGQRVRVFCEGAWRRRACGQEG